VLRRAFQSALLCSLWASAAACSTPISPYAQLDDEEELDDDAGAFEPTPALDAGRGRDAGSSVGARDAGTPGAARDAGSSAGRDAGSSAGRDAGNSAGRDAGQPSTATNCMRVPTAGVASLLVDGCAKRSPISCSAANQSQQQVVNQHLADVAQKCGGPSGVNIGIVLGADGCPTQLRYEDMAVFGRVSLCMQSILENERFGCSLSCALIGPAAR
jgi:hypothetical protein